MSIINYLTHRNSIQNIINLTRILKKKKKKKKKKKRSLVTSITKNTKLFQTSLLFKWGGAVSCLD